MKASYHVMFKKLLQLLFYFWSGSHGSERKAIVKGINLKVYFCLLCALVPITTIINFLLIFLEFPYAFINIFENILTITTLSFSKRCHTNFPTPEWQYLRLKWWSQACHSAKWFVEPFLAGAITVRLSYWTCQLTWGCFNYMSFKQMQWQTNEGDFSVLGLGSLP